METPRLVVSVPVWNTPSHLVNRSVESLLDQSGVDVRVVVTFDGPDQREQHPHLPNDPRVISHQLPLNRGRYYCDAVVLEAIKRQKSLWFAIQDADDYSDTNRFSQQLAQTIADGNEASCGPYWVHSNGGRGVVRKPNSRRFNNLNQNMTHLVHWGSSVATVRRHVAAGGIAAQFRIGFDTLHTLMLRLTGDMTVTEQAGFHWDRRTSGSLTTSPDTRIGSRNRAQVKRRLEDLWKQAYAQRNGQPGGVIRGSVPMALRRQITADATNLKALL